MNQQITCAPALCAPYLSRRRTRRSTGSVKVWSGSLKTLIARREKSFTSNLLKKQVSLQQLIPSRSVPKARFEASAKFGLDPDTLDAFFAKFSFSDLEQDLSCVNLPDTERSVVANFPCWDKSTPVDALRVFTDGSHFESAALSGWAALFFVQPSDVWHFAGFICGRIQGSTLEPGFRSLGFHAFSAEVVALLVALAFCGSSDVPLAELRYDATAAANVVLGEDWPSQPLQPCIVGKLLLRYVRQRGVDVSWRHVKAHQGCPFNDFVDAVAKHWQRSDLQLLMTSEP